jgi:hypothetical protein
MTDHVISMKLQSEPISTDQGKPYQAVPVTNECALPGAFNPRGAYRLPSSISKPDAELIAAARNWRDQADGFFE